MDRDFKGVWIPKEVWLDERLNALEKIILVEIDSLDCEESGCYASNEYIAEFCQCSITKVSLAIKKLITLGYIYTASFDGRTRLLKSRLSKNERQPNTKLKAESQKVKDNNIDINNNTNNKNINTFKKKIEKEKNSDDSTLVYEYYLNKAIELGFAKKMVSPTKITMVYIRSYLKEYSLDDMKEIIDRYFEVISDRDYFFDTYWQPEKFFKQKNAFKEFLDDGLKWLNYQSFKKSKPKQDRYNSNKLENQSNEWAHDFFNSLPGTFNPK